MAAKKGAIVILCLLAVLIFSLWWGVPTYRKAKADALVNELCVKDGGIKVYETVRLPPSHFDEHGNVRVVFSPKPGDEFGGKLETSWIVPEGAPGELSIARQTYKLYRVSDGKLLGESTSYLRRGGDPPSLSHPSAYRCPEAVGIEKKVFVKLESTEGK